MSRIQLRIAQKPLDQQQLGRLITMWRIRSQHSQKQRDQPLLGQLIIMSHIRLRTNQRMLGRLTILTLNGMMNDYRVIRNDEHNYSRLHPDSTIKRHHQTISYLKAVLPDMKDKKVVFVGHHGPSAMSTHPRYVNETLMNGGYRSELSEFILDNPQIKL